MSRIKAQEKVVQVDVRQQLEVIEDTDTQRMESFSHDQGLSHSGTEDKAGRGRTVTEAEELQLSYIRYDVDTSDDEDIFLLQRDIVSQEYEAVLQTYTMSQDDESLPQTYTPSQNYEGILQTCTISQDGGGILQTDTISQDGEGILQTDTVSQDGQGILQTDTISQDGEGIFQTYTPPQDGADILQTDTVSQGGEGILQTDTLPQERSITEPLAQELTFQIPDFDTFFDLSSSENLEFRCITPDITESSYDSTLQETRESPTLEDKMIQKQNTTNQLNGLADKMHSLISNMSLVEEHANLSPSDGIELEGDTNKKLDGAQSSVESLNLDEADIVTEDTRGRNSKSKSQCGSSDSSASYLDEADVEENHKAMNKMTNEYRQTLLRQRMEKRSVDTYTSLYGNPPKQTTHTKHKSQTKQSESFTMTNNEAKSGHDETQKQEEQTKNMKESQLKDIDIPDDNEETDSLQPRVTQAYEMQKQHQLCQLQELENELKYYNDTRLSSEADIGRLNNPPCGQDSQCDSDNLRTLYQHN